MSIKGLGGQPDLKTVISDLNDDVADVVSLAARNGLAVAVLDASGNQISSFGSANPSTVWTKNHFPAANTQATASQTAAGVGVKNVCTGVTIALASSSTTAPAAIQVSVALRDGASGAGTVLWGAVIALPAVAGAMTAIVRSGIWVIGSANTAMTLEFSAAGGANTIESVSMEGTTV